MILIEIFILLINFVAANDKTIKYQLSEDNIIFSDHLQLAVVGDNGFEFGEIVSSNDIKIDDYVFWPSMKNNKELIVIKVQFVSRLDEHNFCFAANDEFILCSNSFF